jgi:hypothetical protein
MPTVRFTPRDRRPSNVETQDAGIAHHFESFHDEESLVCDDRERRRPALHVEDRVVKLLRQDGLPMSAIRNRGCDRGRPLS